MTKSQLKDLIKDIIKENYQNDINEISKSDIMSFGLATLLGIGSGLGIHYHNKNKLNTTNAIVKNAFSNPNLRSNYSNVKNITIDLNIFLNSLYKNYKSASSSYNNFLNNTLKYKNDLNNSIINSLNNNSSISFIPSTYLSDFLNTIDSTIKNNIINISQDTANTILSNLSINNPSLKHNDNLKQSIQTIIILKIIDDAFIYSIKDLKSHSSKKPFQSA